MNISDLVPIESSSSTTYLGFPRTTIKIVGQHCFKFNFAVLHQVAFHGYVAWNRPLRIRGRCINFKVGLKGLTFYRLSARHKQLWLTLGFIQRVHSWRLSGVLTEVTCLSYSGIRKGHNPWSQWTRHERNYSRFNGLGKLGCGSHLMNSASYFSLNRSQQLPAPYKWPINGLKQNWQRQND